MVGLLFGFVCLAAFMWKSRNAVIFQ